MDVMQQVSQLLSACSLLNVGVVCVLSPRHTAFRNRARPEELPWSQCRAAAGAQVLPELMGRPAVHHEGNVCVCACVDAGYQQLRRALPLTPRSALTPTRRHSYCAAAPVLG